MPPLCRNLRHQLPEGRHGPGWNAPEVQELVDHARACAACDAWLARSERLQGLLHMLPRHAAPQVLDGLVSQALGAEGRCERIEAALRSLGRQPSPAELETAIEALAAPTLPAPRAPAVLERLVIEELADPRKARARRFLGSLERLAAPRRLTHTVAHELARPALRPRRSPTWMASTLLLASALIAALAMPLVRREEPPERRMLRLEPITSSAQLDPLARGLLDALSGGLVSMESF